MTWQQLFKGLLQVAQLAFLMPNFRYLTFLTVIWREKNPVWHVFGPLWWCWQQKDVVWNLSPLSKDKM